MNCTSNTARYFWFSSRKENQFEPLVFNEKLKQEASLAFKNRTSQPILINNAFNCLVMLPAAIIILYFLPLFPGISGCLSKPPFEGQP